MKKLALILPLMLMACGGEMTEYLEGGNYAEVTVTLFNNCAPSVHADTDKMKHTFFFSDDLPLGAYLTRTEFKKDNCRVILTEDTVVLSKYYQTISTYQYCCSSTQYPDCVAEELITGARE